MQASQLFFVSPKDLVGSELESGYDLLPGRSEVERISLHFCMECVLVCITSTYCP